MAEVIKIPSLEVGTTIWWSELDSYAGTVTVKSAMIVQLKDEAGMYAALDEDGVLRLIQHNSRGFYTTRGEAGYEGHRQVIAKCERRLSDVLDDIKSGQKKARLFRASIKRLKAAQEQVSEASDGG